MREGGISDCNDLITILAPPKNRIGKAEGPHEHHFYEGAVMLAYATHLLRTTKTKEVRIHPDGMHGKQFDFVGSLLRRGFVISTRTGKTGYGGTYVDEQGRKIVLNPKSGLGDVVAEIDGVIISAECKGASSTRGMRVKSPVSIRVSARPSAG